MKKEDPLRNREKILRLNFLPDRDLSPGDFAALHALCADVLGRDPAIVMDDFDLVHIGIPGPGGLAVAVANQIPAHLAFFTDTAHSRHISTPPTVRYF